MRRHTAVISALALVAAAAPAVVLGSADALQAPVAFTSAALSTYQTNGIAWAVASAQGKVFVGGTFTSVRPAGSAAGTNETARTNFVVLDAATGAPTSCAPAFTGPSATVRAISASPDGRTIYVGGLFTSAGGQSRTSMAALDVATCTIVSTFKPSANATVRAIKATPTSVYFGGDIVLVNGVARSYAAAAAAVGQPNAGALLPWAPQLSLNVRAIATKPDNSAVVIGGNFDTVNGVTSNRLVVVDPTTGTTNLATFTGLNSQNSAVKSIAVDSTGFYTGNEGTHSGSFDGRLAFNWDYTQRWRDDCQGATQAVVVYQSVVYSGSHAHDCTNMGEFPDGVRNHLLAERTTDPHKISWFPQTNDGLGEALGPRAMAIATSSAGKDYLYVVGEFTTVNGVAQQGITRFGPGPDTVAPSTPQVSVQSVRAGQVRVQWRPSLDTDDSTLTYRVFRDGSTTPLTTVSATSWFWNRPQLTYTDTIAAGTTHSYTVSASDGTNTRTSAAQSITVASSTPAYAAAVLADSPVMYLRYDEASGSFLSDTSASANNLTLSGSATYRQAPGVAGASRSITLGGTTTTLYGEKRLAPTPSVSLETWFKTTSTTGGKLIGFGNKQTFASSSTDRNLYLTSNGRIAFGVYTGSYVALITSASYNDGAWHHVVATQGTAGMAVYVDGVLRASNKVTARSSAQGYWHVGGDGLSSSWPSKPTSTYFQGSLDETAIYSTALTAARVSAHYAAR